MNEFNGSTAVRRLLLAATAVLALGLLAPAAHADKPVRIPPAPIPDSTISGVCAFPVIEHFDVNNETTTIFADGRIEVTGAFKVTLTNATDPTKSIQLNVPGPGSVETTSDDAPLLTAEGRWVFIFVPGNLGPGTSGSLLLTTGKATLLGSPDGTQVFTHTGGTTTDLCALLA
jgi:hypothetical protein